MGLFVKCPVLFVVARCESSVVGVRIHFCIFEGRLTQNHRKKDVPECEHINRFTHIGLLVVDFRGIVELCAVVVISEPVLLF